MLRVSGLEDAEEIMRNYQSVLRLIQLFESGFMLSGVDFSFVFLSIRTKREAEHNISKLSTATVPDPSFPSSYANFNDLRTSNIPFEQFEFSPDRVNILIHGYNTHEHRELYCLNSDGECTFGFPLRLRIYSRFEFIMNNKGKIE